LKMRRTVAVMMLALVVALTLTVQLASSAASASAGREPVTLVLANYFNGARIPLVDYQLQLFQEKYPWITVINQVTSSSAVEKYLVSIAAGSPPDVWMFDRIRIPEFVESGLIQPLDDFMQQDGFDMNLFYPSEQQLCQYKGKYYSLPMMAAGMSLLYYNRELLAQGGYNRDGAPKTWQEFLQMATRLQRIGSDGKVQINGGDISYFPRYRLAQLAYTNGARIYDDPFNINYLTDSVREAADWAVEFAQRVPVGGAMAAGTRVFQTHGEWFYFTTKATNPELDLGIALLPHGPRGETVNLSGAAYSYGIPVGVKHPYESWLLIKFLTTSEEAGRIIAFEQGRPSSVIRFNLDRRYFETNPFWHVVAENLNRTIGIAPSPLAVKFYTTDVKYYEQLLSLNQSREEILNNLQKEIENHIADYRAGR